MIDTLTKGARLFRNRPLQFSRTLRGYVLFLRTRMLRRFVLNSKNGIRLGKNVRVQKLSCLSAERPAASIAVGSDSIIYENARVEAYGNGQITVGSSSILGDVRIYSRARIRIGKRVVTSWNVFIQDFDPHPIEPELRGLQLSQMCEAFRPSFDRVGKQTGRPPREVRPIPWVFPTAAIEIGDDVWIGANVTVLKGAKIGNGCVLATGAVVLAGDYPARSILGGVPARVLRTLEAREVVR